jgi:hypothetical protein
MPQPVPFVWIFPKTLLINPSQYTFRSLLMDIHMHFLILIVINPFIIKQNCLHGSLLDGVANGGLSGADVDIVNYTALMADVTGVVSHSLQKVHLYTVAGLVGQNMVWCLT